MVGSFDEDRKRWWVVRGHTLIAKNKVDPIEPKYAAVKGSRGPEIRCLAYVTGPINTAQEAKNSKDPNDHLGG